MYGTDADTGKRLAGGEHLVQSISDILLTPRGSRVLLREYGSDLYKLVDAPQDDILRVRIIRESATALERWEPRLRLSRVAVTFVRAGEFMLTLTGINLENNAQLRLEGLKIDRRTTDY